VSGGRIWIFYSQNAYKFGLCSATFGIYVSDFCKPKGKLSILNVYIFGINRSFLFSNPFDTQVLLNSTQRVSAYHRHMTLRVCCKFKGVDAA
jgi:hypothetical protein